MSVHVKRMWGGGPLRMFSNTRDPQATIRYHNADIDGFAGSYVCELCERPVDGVYFVKSETKWLCGGCRELVRTPKPLDKRIAK